MTRSGSGHRTPRSLADTYLKVYALGLIPRAVAAASASAPHCKGCKVEQEYTTRISSIIVIMMLKVGGGGTSLSDMDSFHDFKLEAT
jgi:hypothetical protein